MKITATDIKIALLEYFRFKRQWICVDECLNADIVADAGNYVVEVEVKISKADLKRDKKKRWKHDNFMYARFKKYMPNKFYFCVPMDLKEAAVEMAYELNPKYGVIVYDPNERDREPLLIVKSALLLHGGYSEKHRHQIAKRASSKLITLMRKINDKAKGETA